MALGDLIVKLVFETKGEDKAKDAMSALKKGALAVTAALAGFAIGKRFVGIIEETRILADEMDKTSLQTGTTVQALQELRFAADLAGVNAGEFANALGRMQKNAFEASKGNKVMVDDFARLGINVRNASGGVKDASTLFDEFAAGIKNTDDATVALGLAQNLMGKQGRRLLPLFKEGGEGLEKMRQEARDLGGIFSKNLVKDMVKLTDDMVRLDFAVRGLKGLLAGELGPVLIEITMGLIEFAKSMVGPVTFAIKFVKRTIGILVTAFKNWLEVSPLLTVSLTAITAAVVGLKVAFAILGKTATVAILKILAPFLLIGAAIGFIILLVDDFLTFLEGGDSLIQRLVNDVKFFINELTGIGPAFDDITDGLAALIGFIANIFDKAFNSIKKFFLNVFNAAVDWGADFLSIFPELFRGVMFVFNEIGKFIVGSIDKAVEKAKRKFRELTDFLGFTEKTARFGNANFEQTTRTIAETAGGVNDRVQSIIEQQPASAQSFSTGSARMQQPNQTQTNQSTINITVDASGAAADADRISTRVAQEVDKVNQRMFRQGKNAFATGST